MQLPGNKFSTSRWLPGELCVTGQTYLAQMKTQTKTNSIGSRTRYDRRDKTRSCLAQRSLFYLRKGRRISVPLIDATQKGARVILPRELSHRATVTLVCKLDRVEHLVEYRVVWKQPIAGRKVIAGLHCIFEGKRKAA